MEKMKVFLTQKVNKNTFKDDNVKRAIKLTLCGALIVALMIQAIGCFFAPMSAFAAVPGDTVVINDIPSLPAVTLKDMDAVFESNGTTYYGISIGSSGISYYTSTDLAIDVYTNLSWTNQAFRTITITQMAVAPLSWVSENSVVQESTMILKAGTYRFNDVVDVSSYPIEYIAWFNFTTGQSFTDNFIGLSCYTVNGEPNGVAYWYAADDFETAYSIEYGWVNGYQSIVIIDDLIASDQYGTWFISNTNYNEVNAPTVGYDFTGETRLFNAQLTRPPMVQADVEQYVYEFDFKVYGGYTADYFIIGRSLNEWVVKYSFIDEGSGGITTMYRQYFNETDGRWLYPRNRLIEFISNPEDPELQQWLLDNTVLVDNTSVGIGYDYGYDIGYNDGWTNSAIGDTLKAPVDALNGIVLLQTADVTITLGGVIFTMVVLSIMLIFLKKYAGG